MEYSYLFPALHMQECAYNPITKSLTFSPEIINSTHYKSSYTYLDPVNNNITVELIEVLLQAIRSGFVNAIDMY